MTSANLCCLCQKLKNRGLIFHSTDRTSDVNIPFIIWLNWVCEKISFSRALIRLSCMHQFHEQGRSISYGLTRYWFLTWRIATIIITTSLISWTFTVSKATIITLLRTKGSSWSRTFSRFGCYAWKKCGMTVMSYFLEEVNSKSRHSHCSEIKIHRFRFRFIQKTTYFKRNPLGTIIYEYFPQSQCLVTPLNGLETQSKVTMLVTPHPW
jgi:hypothetical protein